MLHSVARYNVEELYCKALTNNCLDFLWGENQGETQGYNYPMFSGTKNKEMDIA